MSKQLINNRFGRLTAVEYIPGTHDVRARYKCLCDCGNVTSVRVSHLTGGLIESCGCLQKERASASSATHRRSQTPEWRAWSNMKRRCYTKSSSRYPRYGGRGIVVCDRWLNSFEAFYADMGPRPSSRHSLERIDNDAPYSPDNCKWALPVEQAANRSTSTHIFFSGETLSLKEWSERTNIKRLTLYARLKSGWSIERALSTPTGTNGHQ
jgi:hypothetical protein